MPPLITYVLLVCIGLYGLIIIADLIISRKIKRGIIEGIILITVVIVLRVATGFPNPIRSFGGLSPLIAIAIMFLCTLFGMSARYIFYQKDNFSWGKFLRPLVISPIILLPLFGTLQGISEFKPIQLLSFGILSYQNGFFWKEIFERVQRENVQRNTPKKDE